MNITQIRNATIVLELAGETILVDPMFAPRGAIGSLKYAVRQRRRNPLVDLPAVTDEVLSRVTSCLITHCQKGHFDHLDRLATKWLRDNNIPVFCSMQDAAYLTAKGLQVTVLDPDLTNRFFTGKITLVPCLHGQGLIGRMMAHGYGYHIELPGEPTVYLAGDTILTTEVRRHLEEVKPDVSIIPAGGARMDLGSEIIMGFEEAIAVGHCAEGVVIANHLESLDHCPVERAQIRQEVLRQGWGDRYFVPDDGECLKFTDA